MGTFHRNTEAPPEAGGQVTTMTGTTPTKPTLKTYWSASLKRAVTVPENSERIQIDELLLATHYLLGAIQLTGLTPTDPAAREAWDRLVARTTRAVAAIK